MNMTKIPQERSDENSKNKHIDVRKILQNSIDIKIKFTELLNGLSVRAKNILRQHNIMNPVDLLPWMEENHISFSVFQNCGQKTSMELDEMLENFRKYMCTFLFKNTDEIARELLKCSESVMIKEKFEELLTTLSVRSYNILKKNNLLEVSALWNYFDTPMFDYKNLRGCGTKSTMEIRQMIISLRHFVDSLAMHQEQNTDILIDLPLGVLKSIERNDWEFVSNYKTLHGHWPMFFLLQSYLISSEEKNEQIFTQTWVLQDNVKISVSATEYSRRIAYLLSHQSSNMRIILGMEDWKFYNILKLPYSVKAYFDDIKNEEHLKSELCVSALLMFHGKRLYMFNSENLSVANFYVNPHKDIPIFLDNKYVEFNLRKVLAEIKRLIELKTDQEIKISLLTYFVKNEEYWASAFIYEHMSEIDWNIVLSFLENVLKDIREISNHCLIIKANIINYQEVFYDILKEEGVRLHSEEIFLKLIEKSRNLGFVCKFNNSTQIKRFLFADKRIVAIGKSSYWGLKEWGNASISIKNVTIEIVSEYDVPIQIDELALKALEYRPDSNIKSITAIIRQNTYTGDLSLFFGDYVGLPNKTYSGGFILFPRDFNEWVLTLKEFVIKNNRFPYSNQKGYEGYLYRWYSKAKNFVNLSAEEILSIESLEKELSLYPHDSREVLFRENCILYQKFVERNRRMVQLEDDKNLYLWFSAAKKKNDTLTNNQKFYFSKLLKALTEILY